MVADNTYTEKFVADVAAFVRDVQRAAKEADHFGNANSSAGLAARKMGLAASEAGRAAERASLAAYEAAKKLERGELDVAKAAEIAAKASDAVERASIKEAEAMRAAAKAADEEAQQLHQLGRAATEAAAMEELGRLRASKSIKDHNALLTRMRHDYHGFGQDIEEMGTLGEKAFGMLSSAGSSAMNAISAAGQSMAELGPLWIAGITAGIAALPLIATVAAGAITLGLGGALAGVGIMAALQSKKVRQSFSDLANDAKKQAAQWAAPWTPAMVSIAHDFDGVIKSFGPTMTDIFSRMAPAVQDFATHLAGSLDALQPALVDVGNGFDKILADLGPSLPALMESLSQGISAVAQAAGDHSAEIVRFVLAMGQLVEYTGKAIKVLADIEPVLDPATNLFDALGVGAQSAAGGLATFGSAEASAAVKAVDLSGTTQHVANVMDLASQSAEQLKTSLDKLVGKELTAREAAAQYGAAIINMTRAIKSNGDAHGYATEKGIKNEEALTALAKAAAENTVAMRADGASAQTVARFMDTARAKIYNAAREMGYGKKAAEDLATKLSGISAAAARIPRTVTIYFKTNLTGVDPRVNIGSFINRAHGGPIHRAYGGPIGHYAAGGEPTYMPVGGPVHGPGTSTSDSIPLWASDGEFMVNAAAYQANKVLVNAINAAGGREINSVMTPKNSHQMVPTGGHFDTMKPLPMPTARRHYAETLNGSSGGSQAQVVNHHNVYVAGSVWSEQELARVIQALVLSGRLSLSLPAGR